MEDRHGVREGEVKDKHTRAVCVAREKSSDRKELAGREMSERPMY